MTVRLPMTIVPEPRVDRDAGIVGVAESIRVINQNFRQVRDLIERAILVGDLIAAGSITSAMLSTGARTIVGDVTGLTGAAADGGTTTVTKIRGKTVASPVAGDDAKALVYDHAGVAFGYADVLRDVLTTRGDLLYRGASAESRLAVGSANQVLRSDGTDPAWIGVSGLLDNLFSSSQGAVLYRGASAWAALSPGASGEFLKTQGAGANPVWGTPSGSTPVTTKGDLFGYDTGPARIPVGTNGHVLTADSAEALGVKWAASAAASPNALLDGSAHSDTVAQAVSRGSLIYGNSTPAWTELTIGAKNKVVRSDGTDLAWQFNRAEMANSSFIASGIFGNNTINSNAGLFTFSNAGGTQAASGDADRVANKYTQAVANGKTGPQAPTSGPLLTPAMSPVFWADFKLVTFTLCYLQVGFNSGGLQGSATKSTTVHQAWLTFLAGTDTNFYFRLCDATTANAIDTGVAKDTAWHDVLIYSPDAGVTWYCELDGVQVASSATNVPGTTQLLYSCVGFTCGTGGTQTGELRTSYCKVQQVGRM